MNFERHIVYGTDLAFAASTEHGLAKEENFRQISNFDEGRGHAIFDFSPTAYAVGCILKPFRGCAHACTAVGLLAINWRSTNCRMPPLA